MGGNYCRHAGGNKLSTIPKNHWLTIDLDSILYIKYYIVLYVIKLGEKIRLQLERCTYLSCLVGSSLYCSMPIP